MSLLECGVGKMSEVEVGVKDMDAGGGFVCPKCKSYVNPDEEEEYEVVDVEGECGAHRLWFLTIKHRCGQVIKIDVRSER